MAKNNHTLKILYKYIKANTSAIRGVEGGGGGRPGGAGWGGGGGGA